MRTDRRGSIQLVDALMTFVLVVALMVLAPTFYEFTAMASDSADGLSAMLLELALPILFVALIISVGVSARR